MCSCTIGAQRKRSGEGGVQHHHHLLNSVSREARLQTNQVETRVARCRRCLCNTQTGMGSTQPSHGRRPKAGRPIRLSPARRAP